MDALWLGSPLDIDIKTAITVLMHSYNNDIADVLNKEISYVFSKWLI